MKKSAVCLSIFLAITFYSNGQDRFVLEGTVGKYPIVMLIEEDNGNIGVTYFYKKYRRDIELEGKIVSDDQWVFDKKAYNVLTQKDEMVEQFKLKRSVNTWLGQWRNAKGMV